jgi:serpin B
MKDMFLEEFADLSGITGSQDLYVSDVLQKAFLEVSELGTEAGASSGKSQQEKSVMSVFNLYCDLSLIM